MDRSQTPQERAHERTTYRYLQALETGDIDTLIKVLQQAVYDAPLEEMVLESHQAYFQAEQAEKIAMEKTETQGTLPSLAPPERHALPPTQRATRLRRMRRWPQALAAVLIIGALLGGFITLLSLRHSGAQNAGQPTVTSTACQSYPLKQFSTPSHGNAIDALFSVATVSANDAWAVGDSTPNSAGLAAYTTLIEHWDGRNWAPVPGPNAGNGGVLNAVSAVSANDVWAVGYSYTGAMPSSLNTNKHPLVEHWNGTTWSVVPSPDGPGGDGVLTAISAASANDVWAVGTTSSVATLVEHWDGTDWKFVSGNETLKTLLYGVTALSANDVWITGGLLINGQYHAVVRHWNGTTWETLPTLPAYSVFFTLSVISANNIWTTGEVQTSASEYSTEIEHWDGNQWSQVVLPASYQVQDVFHVVAVAANDIWVSGGSQNSQHIEFALLLHWNGKTWQKVQTPLGRAGVGLAVFGQQQIWIVGGGIGSSGPNGAPIILGQRTCP